jgi:hypothetical protein
MVVSVSYLRSCNVLQSAPEITVCGYLGWKLGWILYSSPMPYPSCKKGNMGKLCHISLIMWWHTVLFNIMWWHTFLFNIMWWHTFLLNITLFLQRQSSRRQNQLDATQYFIELVIGSTCFGHHYAHRQELKTIPLITT